MNQEKIGKFIAESRKKNNLTQAMLASKLGVSEKAISNWENGRNMPDLSLFKPLCDELKITINELMSGEKVDKNIYQEKLEENIINTIDYSNKKIEQKNRIIGLILLLLGFSICILGLMAFDPDTHACSFSIVIGMMFSMLGFYKCIKTKSYLKNIIFLFLFFIGYLGTILFFDFIGTKYNQRPPIFAVTITTGETTIYYDTLFYDVIRCNRNEENESYKVVKNQKLTDELEQRLCG